MSTGTASIVPTPVVSGPREGELRRFFAHVEFTETCWLWRGGLSRGYGMFSARPGMALAHRWLFKALRWNPGELTLDHLCRARHCVNVFDHLEPVPLGENIRRGYGIPGVNARKVHCKHGHPFDEENTYVAPDGRRNCRECKRQRMRRYRAWRAR